MSLDEDYFEALANATESHDGLDELRRNLRANYDETKVRTFINQERAKKGLPPATFKPSAHDSSDSNNDDDEDGEGKVLVALTPAKKTRPRPGRHVPRLSDSAIHTETVHSSKKVPIRAEKRRHEEQVPRTARRRAAGGASVQVDPEDDKCEFCHMGRDIPGITDMKFMTDTYLNDGDRVAFDPTPMLVTPRSRKDEAKWEGRWVHRSCALYAPRVTEAQDGSLRSVVSEINRSKALPCIYCKKRYAPTGCGYSKCMMNAHFSCLVLHERLAPMVRAFQVFEAPKKERAYLRKHGHWGYDMKKYEVFCPLHTTPNLFVVTVPGPPLTPPWESPSEYVGKNDALDAAENISSDSDDPEPQQPQPPRQRIVVDGEPRTPELHLNEDEPAPIAAVNDYDDEEAGYQVPRTPQLEWLDAEHHVSTVDKQLDELSDSISEVSLNDAGGYADDNDDEQHVKLAGFSERMMRALQELERGTLPSHADAPLLCDPALHFVFQLRVIAAIVNIMQVFKGLGCSPSQGHIVNVLPEVIALRPPFENREPFAAPNIKVVLSKGQSYHFAAHELLKEQPAPIFGYFREAVETARKNKPHIVSVAMPIKILRDYRNISEAILAEAKGFRANAQRQFVYNETDDWNSFDVIDRSLDDHQCRLAFITYRYGERAQVFSTIYSYTGNSVPPASWFGATGKDCVLRAAIMKACIQEPPQFTREGAPIAVEKIALVAKDSDFQLEITTRHDGTFHAKIPATEEEEITGVRHSPSLMMIRADVVLPN